MESNTQNADLNSGKKPEKGLGWNQLSLQSAFIAVTVGGVLLANYHNNRRQVDEYFAEIRASLNARLNPSPKNVPLPAEPTPISISISVPLPPPPINGVQDVNDGDTVSSTLTAKSISIQQEKKEEPREPNDILEEKGKDKQLQDLLQRSEE